MCLKKYQLSSVFLILFIFFLSNKNSLAIENKIILKVNNEIITSVDVFNEAKYLKTLNKNLKNISDKEIIKLAKNSLLREKIKIIELSKYLSYQTYQLHPLVEIDLPTNNEQVS